MKLQYFSHRHADKILASCGMLQELEAVFNDLCVPVYPGKSEAKARNSHQQVIVPSMLNTIIELKLTALGWLSQPLVKTIVDEGKTRYYADFYKQATAESVMRFVGEGGATVQALVEVQFAYTARADSDLKKFNIGFSQGRCDVGVLVVPMKAMACHINTGVANFESVVDGLLELGVLMTPVPLLIIGLSEEEAPRVDLSLSVFTSHKQLTGEGSKKNRIIAAHALLRGVPVELIGPSCELPLGSETLSAGEALERDERMDACPE